jgi:hypothetical protein
MHTNTLPMSDKQLTRYRTLTALIDKHKTVAETATQLGLSQRQVIRLAHAVKERGAEALVHGNTGKTGNRALQKETREMIANIITAQYPDFGPTLAQEKLAELHNITVSDETVRTIMIQNNLWKPKPRKGAVEYRRKRERKEYYGEMIQFDGSYHAWLEGRDGADKSCLLVAIDDATGKLIKIELRDGEGKKDVFCFWMDYVRTHGAPKSLYIDRFSTYKINDPSVADLHLHTEFEQAMKRLNVHTISAHSPQAKGRVERVNSTLQDRLVKELRLHGISDREAANQFMRDVFVPQFNTKFAVVPTHNGDIHRPLTDTESDQLPSIFATHTSRIVGNDFTIRFKKKCYQLTKEQTVTVCRKDTVIVEERLDSTLHILHAKRQRYLSFTEVVGKPEQRRAQAVLPATRKAQKPAANHPWRKSFITQKKSAPATATA